MLTPFEQSVRNLTERLLEEYRMTLNDLELRADLRGIRIIDAAPESRHSELEVVFYRGRDIADVFEFFVEDGGKPNATLQEVEEWLRGELAGLRDRHT